MRNKYFTYLKGTQLKYCRSPHTNTKNLNKNAFGNGAKPSVFFMAHEKVCGAERTSKTFNYTNSREKSLNPYANKSNCPYENPTFST